jgi:hypothetical protein
MIASEVRETRSRFVFPSFHRRFSAQGRAARPLAERQFAPLSFGAICHTNVSSSGSLSESPLQAEIWKPVNGSLPHSWLLQFETVHTYVSAQWLETVDAARKPAHNEATEGQIEDFLDQIYKLAGAHDTEAATDLIFEHIDRLLCDGLFVVCDDILRKIDVTNLSTSLMRSLLAITAPAKARLPARKALYEDVERVMRLTKGDAKTKRLIQKLA